MAAIQTEIRIAKLVGKEKDLFVGEAEGIKWEVIPKPFASGPTLQVGDYVPCYVLQETNSENWYLEQVPEQPLSTETEWIKQEDQL